MNYRHAYHAGNFADVLKHVVLVKIISHLKQKPAAFRVIDTHAGIGVYDLEGVEAGKTDEWQDGIGRLLNQPIDAGLEDALSSYLSIVRDVNAHGQVNRYPGSPAIARQLLRADDRLLVNELHSDDRAALAGAFRRDQQVKVMGLDGWVVLKSVLPPKERRGVILIDPPFEEAGEFSRLLRGLADGMKRFATGIYMLWYPLKDVDAVGGFKRDLAQLGLSRVLDVELDVGKRSVRSDALQRGVDLHARGPGLTGTGLIVVNPPYLLDTFLTGLLPLLEQALRQGPGASHKVEWLVE